MAVSGKLSEMGFYSFPVAIFTVVIPVIFLEKVKWLDFIPAIFIGAGAFMIRDAYEKRVTKGFA